MTITNRNSCDVLVIGAGVIGLSIGIALLQNRPSLKVKIVDKEKDIADKCKEDSCNVCLFSNNDSYLSKNFCDVEHISSYIIVRNIVE